MDHGEFLTRLTIWMAVCGYAIGAISMRKSGGRGAWTFGCVCFLAHVACAFSFHHHWSHADARAETARQAAELTGIHWDGGIFFNYLFAIVWFGDVLWWWLAPDGFVQRSRWITTAVHGFMFFMVFNGAFVFARSPLRWAGLSICAMLAVAWWRGRRGGRTL